MHMRRSPVILLALLVTAVACDRSTPLEIDADPLFKSDHGQGRGQFVNVLSRNLYIGTDLGVVLQSPAEQIPLAVGQAHREVIASDPPARMARMADEIAREHPDLIGLQEVYRIDVNGVPQFDFLELLMASLRERGLRYEVAATVTNVDLTLPALNPLGQLYFAGMVDRDVILVRKGIQYANAQSGHFSAALPVSLGGQSFEILRGWNSVDARVRGRMLRFVNTHLEVAAVRPVNEAQGLELLQLVSGSPHPVVLAGDLNSAANESAPAEAKTDTYGWVLDAGFDDVWTLTNPGAEGLTCCHAPDLQNTTSTFDRRIDFIFLDPRMRAAESALVVGDDPADPAMSVLPPSDHAGVFGLLRLP